MPLRGARATSASSITPAAAAAVRTETHKNGHSARAGDARLLPSALDRENGVAQSSVRGRQISRGRLSVPRR
eukprot:COSAG02_NODE_2486_length_8709_cov_5.616725_4_plen_72_part_00